MDEKWYCFRDNYVIFSGGLPATTSAENHCPTAPSLTVIHGKTTTVLEMEHNVLDFIVICESQWESGNFFASKKTAINYLPR